MYVIIRIIFFIQAGAFTFQERPPIDKEQCQIKNQDITPAQEIQAKISFFSMIMILQQFKSEIQEQEKQLNKILDIKLQFQAQSKIIQDGLIQRVKKKVIDKIKNYKTNKSPDDPQVVECYNDIQLLDKKLIQVLELIKNCDVFYQIYFDEQIKNRISDLKQLNQNIDLLQSYRQEEITKKLDQLNRDYIICFQKSFDPINKLQQKFQIQKKKQRYFEKKFKKSNKLKNLLQTNWKLTYYDPIDIENCLKYNDNIEEDFLQFLKIQEIFKEQSGQRNWKNEIVQIFYEFKDNFQKNNKIINQSLIDFHIRPTQTIEYPLNDQYQNSDSGDVAKVYKQYQLYHTNLNRALNNIIVVKELSNLLDDNYFQDLNNLNNKINDYIQNKFTYQQEDVFNQLQQINRDYKICNDNSDHYQEFIRRGQPKVSSTYEPILKNLSPDQESKCEKIYYIKQDILTAYKKLVVIKYNNKWHNYRYDYDSVAKISKLFSGINLKTDLVEFKIYLPNYKPDDIWAVKAYQRLQIINKILINLRENKHKANYFLYHMYSDYSSLNRQIELLQKILYDLPENEISTQQQLDNLLKQYTICTGKNFNDQYQIKNEPKTTQQNKYSDILIEMKPEHPSKPAKSHMDKKNQLIQYSWKYEDYPEIKESECKDEIDQIKEDILELEKIQVLFQYKNKYQKSYNELIAKILAIEIDFLAMAPAVNLEYRIDTTYFIRYPRHNPEFDYSPYTSLIKIVELLDKISQKSGLAKDFFQFNAIDFSSIRYNNKLLNEYLDHGFKHQENDVERELIQLYRDYKICRKVDYNQDSDDQKEIERSTLFLQQNQEGGKKKDKKNKLNSQMKYKQ